MPVTFTYTLQIEATAKTALGRNVSFLLDFPFTDTVDETNHSYQLGKIVSKDVDGNFTPDDLVVIVRDGLYEHCQRHSLVMDSVSILTYTVSTEDEDIEVYFNPLAPSKRTTNGTDRIYAYLITDMEAAPTPTEVTASASSEGIILSWVATGHYHGVRIYDEALGLKASLGENATSWIDTDAVADQLSIYYVSTFHSKGESARVKVTGRIVSEPQIVIPAEHDEEPIVRTPISREDAVLKAFQSGTGDLRDLQVNPSGKHRAREEFGYTMQLKGYEEKSVKVYPEREFQYRIVAHNSYGSLVTSSPWRIGVIDGQEPLNYEGAGKESLRLPLEMDIPSDEVDVEYTIELSDPTGFVRIQLDKGVPPKTMHNDDFITFHSIDESREERLIQIPHYGKKTNATQKLTLNHKEALSIEATIPSVKEEATLMDKNISEWLIVLTSDNPNVKLVVDQEPDTYVTERSFLRFKIKAVIMNQTQAPWNPLIHNGFYYLNQAEHYLYAESKVQGLIGDNYKLVVNAENEIFVSPVPKQGAPVVVRDASGKELTHVTFYSEAGESTLDYKEEAFTSERNELLLSYVDIDKNTLTLSYQNAAGDWDVLTDYLIEDNYIKLYPVVPPGTLVRMSYRLTSSFTVDYLYNPKDGYAKILVHNPILDVTREVSVFYETSSDPYYVGEDVNLNPLKNPQHAGFIYLADKVESSKEIELQLGSHTLFATGHDSTYLRAIALDKIGNPIQGERMVFSAQYGVIEMLQGVTDINGMVMARYTAPSLEVIDTITAINQSTNLSIAKSIYIKNESVGSHISLSTSHPTVFPKWNEVTVTAYLYGENQEPMVGQVVRFQFDSGVANKTEAITDQFGAARIVYAATEIPRTGIVHIRAVNDFLQVEEDTVLRILGFRYYHEDYFMKGNNLIDIYDRLLARENLGITAQALPPSNPEEFDIWMDQGDLLYLQQSYQLRDVADKEEARKNLGIEQSVDEPVSPWQNDIWIDE